MIALKTKNGYYAGRSVQGKLDFTHDMSRALITSDSDGRLFNAVFDAGIRGDIVRVKLCDMQRY